MSIYVKIGKKILKNPNIIRPHVKTKDISELNFKKMKEMGMEKIILSKHNTVCMFEECMEYEMTANDGEVHREEFG